LYSYEATSPRISCRTRHPRTHTAVAAVALLEEWWQLQRWSTLRSRPPGPPPSCVPPAQPMHRGFPPTMLAAAHGTRGSAVGKGGGHHVQKHRTLSVPILMTVSRSVPTTFTQATLTSQCPTMRMVGLSGSRNPSLQRGCYNGSPSDKHTPRAEWIAPVDRGVWRSMHTTAKCNVSLVLPAFRNQVHYHHHYHHHHFRRSCRRRPPSVR
jgi:hypothetical protein